MALGLKYKNQEHIFDEKTVDGVPYLSYPILESTGMVKHGFSTRLGGVSTGHCATMNISTTRGDDPKAVEENRRRIAKAIGVQKISWKNEYDGGPHEANFLKLDCSRLKSTFGWAPVWNVEKAMEMIVEWSVAWRDGRPVAQVMERQLQEFYHPTV